MRQSIPRLLSFAGSWDPGNRRYWSGKAWGNRQLGVTLHGADLLSAFLAALSLGPVPTSLPPCVVFSQLVIRFPHLPLACHLAYPISRFTIPHPWAENTIRPACSSRSSM